MAGNDLEGLRVLVVEDESLVSMLIEDILTDLGCVVVGVAARLDQGIDAISAFSFDAAIVDVNLNGSPSYPIAEMLVHRRIPFIFSTGYGPNGVAENFRGIPVLSKPFQQSDLKAALMAVLAPH